MHILVVAACHGNLQNDGAGRSHCLHHIEPQGPVRTSPEGIFPDSKRVRYRVRSCAWGRKLIWTKLSSHTLTQAKTWGSGLPGESRTWEESANPSLQQHACSALRGPAPCDVMRFPAAHRWCDGIPFMGWA